jgi:hypothetical protein
MLLIQTALVDPVDPEDWLVIAIYWIDKSPAVSRSVPAVFLNRATSGFQPQS